MAGAIAVSAGGTGTNVGLAGAASIARNAINRTTGATVSANSDITSGSTVNVQAIDQSLIQSYVIGAAVSVAAGTGTSAAISIGLSISENLIGNNVSATVDDSTIVSDGNTNVSARTEQVDLFNL